MLSYPHFPNQATLPLFHGQYCHLAIISHYRPNRNRISFGPAMWMVGAVSPERVLDLNIPDLAERFHLSVLAPNDSPSLRGSSD